MWDNNIIMYLEEIIQYYIKLQSSEKNYNYEIIKDVKEKIIEKLNEMCSEIKVHKKYSILEKKYVIELDKKIDSILINYKLKY